MDFVTYIYIIVLLLLKSIECADENTHQQNQDVQHNPVTLQQYGPESDQQPLFYYVHNYQIQPQPDQQPTQPYYGPQHHHQPPPIPEPQPPPQPTQPYYGPIPYQPPAVTQPQQQPLQQPIEPYGPQQPTYQPVQPQYIQPQPYQGYQPVPPQPPPQPTQPDQQPTQPYYGPQHQPQPLQQQPQPPTQPTQPYYGPATQPPQPYQPYYPPQPYDQYQQYYHPQYQPIPTSIPPQQPIAVAVQIPPTQPVTHVEPSQPQPYPYQPQYGTGYQPHQPAQPYQPTPIAVPIPQPQPQYQPYYGPIPYPPTRPQQQPQPIPQYYPRHTAPVRQSSNLGPGILGPAPGPLSEPSHLLYNLSHKYIRPTTQTTEQSTQTTEDSQPTTQHTESTELHPETIPVELGSDEEDESPQEPTQPTELEPETSPVELASDDEDKKPSEAVKICNTITFFKKNDEGNLVPMSWEDYTVIRYNENVVKYIFNAELEAVLCDQDTIFKHLIGREYCKSMINKRHHSSFLFRRSDGFILVKYKNGRWNIKARRNPDFVKLYALDNEGNEIELDDNSYYLKFTSSGSFKYQFLEDIKLNKFLIRGQLVWQKTIEKSYPSAVAVTERYGALVLFDTHIRVYRRFKEKYKFLFNRPIIKNIKK